MQNKTETVVVYLTLAAAITCTISFGILANNAILYVFSIAFIMLFWGYSIYWAFDLRRLLSAQLYRNQALGEGLIAVGWLSFGVSTSVTLETLSSVTLVLALATTFYFIDSSVLAARKSDPLYRNTFHWRQLRFVIWPIIAISLFALLVIGVVAPSFFGSQGGPTWFTILTFIPVFGTLVSAVVLLPFSGRRSRDQTLRKNLEWFGLFGASFMVLTALGLSAAGSLSVVFFSLAFEVGGYCIYRSTKSLAPLNRLPEMKVGAAPIGTEPRLATDSLTSLDLEFHAPVPAGAVHSELIWLIRGLIRLLRISH